MESRKQQSISAACTSVTNLALGAGMRQEPECPNFTPTCSRCDDSGFYGPGGFSACGKCDGIPKPVKRECLELGLVIKRQTSTQFLIIEGSMANSLLEKTVGVERECKLCCVADVANVVLRPCGHGGFCEDCVRRITNEKSTAFCPYCRCPLEAFVKVDPQHQISLTQEQFQVQSSRWKR